jgi:hypothetical protein
MCEEIMKCCCTFLFANIIAALSVAVYLVPNLVIGLIGALISLIVWFPYNFIKTYYTIIFTKLLGPKLKLLVFLTAWIGLFAYPFFVMIIVAIADVLFSVVYVYGDTIAKFINDSSSRSDRECCCSSIRMIATAVGDFWNINYYTIPTELDRLLEYGGHVYEINVLHTIIGTLLGMVGSIVMSVVFCALSILKYIPFLFSIVIQIGKNCVPECCGLWFLLVVISCFVCIGLSPLVIPLSFLGGLLLGFSIVYDYINYGSFYRSFLLIGSMLYQFDISSTSMAFFNSSSDRNNISSCFECFHIMYESQVAQYITPPIYTMYQETDDYIRANSAPHLCVRLTVQEIWNGFFEMCEEVLTDAVINKLITIDDLIGFEPYLFIGLSSLVAFNGIERSVDIYGIKLCSGKIVNTGSKPTDSFSTGIYNTVIDIKGKLKQLNLTQSETLFVKKWLLTVGDEEKCKSYMVGIDALRLTTLKQFTGSVQSVGTNVTRAPTFHRLFGNMLQTVISKKDSFVIDMNAINTLNVV